MQFQSAKFWLFYWAKGNDVTHVPNNILLQFSTHLNQQFKQYFQELPEDLKSDYNY